MRGFKNQILNEIAKNNIFEYMIDFVFISLEQMKKDLLFENRKINNDEEKIRTHLLEKYLNNQEFKQNIQLSDLYLLFNAEVSEGYNEETQEYIGRVDIKVFSINTILTNPKDYYIIECKRVDGSSKLNEKFVTEGICRFVLDNPKYSSFNQKNVMLGFVVEDIDITENVCKINDIQSKNIGIHIIEKMYRCQKQKEEYHLYRNKYQSENKQIELSHIFYNLTQIIK